MANPKRALVTLPEGVWKIIESDLKGKLGDSDSEVIRNIVISYLTEKGYFAAQKVQTPLNAGTSQESARSNTDEILALETMVKALGSLLAEKKIITLQAWKKEIKEIQDD